MVTWGDFRANRERLAQARAELEQVATETGEARPFEPDGHCEANARVIDVEQSMPWWQRW